MLVLSKMPRYEVNATELHRIIGCGGYLQINQLEKSLDKTDEQLEGIAAHEVIRLVLNGTVQSADELIDRTVSGFIVTGDMVEYLTPHIDHIRARGLQVLTEENLNWSIPAPIDALIKCRADGVSYDRATETLYGYEFKYGWRLVEVENHWPLIAYMIGAVINRNWTPQRIVMTIHQPRPFHGDGAIREWVIDGHTLTRLYNEIANRFAQLPNTVTTGAHCYKCDRAAFCPASRMAALASVDISTAAYNENLTDLQTSYELDLLERAQDALKTRFDALKAFATSKGGVTGWGLKQSLGNRKFVEGLDAETLSMLSGVAADKLSKSALVTPAQAEKMGVSKDITAAWTDRPSRGFNLVRMDTNKDAQKLFSPQQQGN